MKINSNKSLTVPILHSYPIIPYQIASWYTYMEVVQTPQCYHHPPYSATRLTLNPRETKKENK